MTAPALYSNRFSKHWKTGCVFFQTLEKYGQAFPNIGKTCVAAVLLLAAAPASQAAVGWYDDYVLLDFQATTGAYYWIGSDPSYGTQLHGSSLGGVTNLVISGCDMKYWSDNQDRTGGSYFWSVDGGAATEVVWSHVSLGGNDYQGTSTADQAVLAGLRVGGHKLEVWAKSWGSSQGDSWLSNGGNNYTSSFTLVLTCLVAPSNGPLAGGNTVVITNCNAVIGTGSDITNILLGTVGTTNIIGQGARWVAFRAPASAAAGLKNIEIQATSGVTTVSGAYTVNPAGQIGWTTEDWGRWQEVAGLPAKRYLLAAGTLNGSLYALGGTEGVTRYSTVYRFDGTSWSVASNLPAERLYLAACEFQGGLHALGGDEEGGAPTDSNFRFDGTNWQTATVMPAINMGLAASVLNDRLYAVGGTWWNSGEVYGYDGTNWAAAASMPAWRYYLAAGTLNGKLYAVGGITDIGIEIANTNVYAFDGSNWEEVAGLPAPRGGLAASVLNGWLYAIGGSSWGATTYTNVYRFDGTNWVEVAGLPQPRAWHAAATLDGAIYAIGGADSQVRTNVYRYPARVVFSGVAPSSGSATGGYPVVISGSNLCNGTLGDVTNVTLCGVAATVTGVAGSTQIVVTVGAAGGSLTGAVRVCSASFGETTRANAFIYEAPALVVLFDFSLHAENGQVQVCWQTASELNTLGFDVYREEAGAWVKANSAMIPAAGWPNGGIGGSYCVADPGANTADTFRYKLVEYETTGGLNEYGPFERSAWTPRVSSVAATPAGMVIQWLSREPEAYDVLKSFDARGPYTPAATGLPATPPINAWTDQTESVGAAFYRIEAR